ncbi:MAG TPA: 30S ribosomal protein S17 [Candidatus Moranbacteria bacterium]|nr:30S ribosomal protein S17 [Candidatus Moranbacteria bacterium]
MESNDKKIARKKGIVVSDKMNKTVIVAVDNLMAHKKYRKRYISTKRYKVHDEENKLKVGDKIEFVAAKPISKGKFYKAV